MKNRFERLYTESGKRLKDEVYDAYPRPQLKRDSYFNLNGFWQFCAVEKNLEPKYDQIIRVPFCPESILSGIEKTYKKGTKLCYKREFSLPSGFVKDKAFLHFGAVDQIAEVYLNGKLLGSHIGGYEAFSFDITDALEDNNELVVIAIDDLDKTLPYGKQKKNRGGMWYTTVSGIWQTVWIESVKNEYIESIKIDPDLKGVTVTVNGADEGKIVITTPEGETELEMMGGAFRFAPENPRFWSPEDPYLYYFKIITATDTVESYFALRTVSIGFSGGIKRLMLNGKPYFFHGLLDQGYFPDGIFTPASPEVFSEDIKAAKELGFNMLRKHIKLEPEQFYYDCDRLGMIVFQDMINNGQYSFFRDTALPTIGIKKLPRIFNLRKKKTKEAFSKAAESMVKTLYNHPSVCYYTIFNEGWGQSANRGMYEKLKAIDSSRIYDTASGWFYEEKTDVESLHIYFKPVKIKKSDKPIVLSEFGGYSWRAEGHIFNPNNTYGYRFFKDQKEFENALVALYENEVIPLVKIGLSADVYTQLTDVEDETNGLLSYDRQVIKVNRDKMQIIAKKLQESCK